MMTLKFDGSGATGQIQDLESLLGEHAAHVPPEFVDNLTVLLEGLTESPHFEPRTPSPRTSASSSSRNKPQSGQAPILTPSMTSTSISPWSQSSTALIRISFITYPSAAGLYPR